LGESNKQFYNFNKMKNKFVKAFIAIVLGSALFTSCKPKNSSDAVSGDAAKKCM
jgi:nitrous-oxide reductase